MTKVKYAITHNDKEITRVNTLQEAQDAIAELGHRFRYKAVYEDYDPEDTPEKREKAREHARKVAEYRKFKKELAHAPAYINNTGVGAT